MYIYISGRGHSGSTILDVLLGNSGTIVSVGELASGLGRVSTGGACSCGASTNDCPFWAKVRQRFVQRSDQSWEEAASSVHRFAHIRNLRLAFFGRRRAGASVGSIEQIVDTIDALEEAIIDVGERPHLLDSSKEVTLAITLLRFRTSTRVIHLVRNPIAVIGSHYWRFRNWAAISSFSGVCTAHPFSTYLLCSSHPSAGWWVTACARPCD